MKSAVQRYNKKVNDERPEWDLGKFIPHRSFQKYSPKRNIAKISLLDGTPCPGVDHARRTKVKFMCVDPRLSMHIANVKEKKTCDYRIYVHVPELCLKNAL